MSHRLRIVYKTFDDVAFDNLNDALKHQNLLEQQDNIKYTLIKYIKNKLGIMPCNYSEISNFIMDNFYDIKDILKE